MDITITPAIFTLALLYLVMGVGVRAMFRAGAAKDGDWGLIFTWPLFLLFAALVSLTEPD